MVGGLLTIFVPKGQKATGTLISSLASLPAPTLLHHVRLLGCVKEGRIVVLYSPVSKEVDPAMFITANVFHGNVFYIYI